MNEFKPKYWIDFRLECSTDKGDLILLLKTLIEVKTEFGLVADRIAWNYAFKQTRYVRVSYDDARSVVNGKMSEVAYIEKYKF